MKQKLLLILMVAVLSYFDALAQNRTITGKVVDADDGLPLPGVSIKIKGTTQLTQTTGQGTFSISVPANAQSLVLSYVGYTEQEVKITGETLNIRMVSSSKNLQDVMIIGYGTIKKENFTGSAAVIDDDVFKDRPVTSFEKALQGAAAGVQVTSVSGQPGATSTVRIRGVGSFTASSTPLYVVDGIAITNGDLSSVAQTSDVLSSINPNDIASVTVLKDATAAAIYGSRAANGVVLITTKQGKAGKTKLNLSSSTGYSYQAVDKHKVMDATQYYKTFWDVYYAQRLAAGLAPDAAATAANGLTNAKLVVNPYNTANPYAANGVLANGASLLYDTDWRDEVLRRGVTKNIDLSASGGNDRSKFFVSGGYFEQNGIVIRSDFKRYSGKFNFNTDVTDFLKVGINNSLTRTEQNTPAGSTGSDNPVNFADQTANIYPLYVRDANGNVVYDATGNPVYNYINPVTPDFNPVGLSKLNEYNTITNRVITSPYAEVRFLKDFVAKSMVGIDYINNRERQFYNMEHGDGVSVKGRAYRYSKEDVTVTFQNTLTYNKTFNQHNFDVLLGQEAYRSKRDFNYSQVTGFPFPGTNEQIAASTPSTVQSYYTQQRFASYFSRLQYNYAGKYYLSGSLRRDGSSVFGNDNKYGTFYSVGGGWRIGRENFLKDVNWIDELKLRASYGTSGNDRIDRYAAQGLYGLGKNYEGQSGINYVQLENVNLKWEQNSTLDIGVEFAFLKGKISGEASYYKRGSKGLLFDQPLTRLTGFDNLTTNLASMDNYGVEILLNGNPVKTKDFDWNISFNITSNRNKINAMTQNEVIDGTKRWKVGADRYQWYLRDYAGVDPADGRPMWYTDEIVNGQATGNRITTKNWSTATRYDGLGSSLPKFTGGFNNTFRYREFDLSVFTYFSTGAKIYDTLYGNLMHSGGAVGKQLSIDNYNSWQKPGDITDVPRFVINNTDLGNNQSTRFLYDGSFMRVKNIALGYSLKKNWLETVHLSNVRVYLMAENPFTWAKHKGMDPESALTGLTDNDIPNVKTFTLGLNVGF
ncbi:TonB-dependent receptor [Pedobacter riviphilus]|uniref:TonB-dependent receptor n=1 Tax=Pedobacter riviphilus TaxID=2766984 RepID=A0ABX6THY0_9SPHI|nr:MULTISPECIES: TonB-dependent receptor [Pedobacter]NII84396.1 TonB-linked SusC/RagA family outer membrane protein [Pedobacter sp. SG908]NMN38689.1 TonB-linked SusC/RagA family outer membrane protein [Pedobacter sp. SG918]QNR84219.1 TonB-dependent receptor [Pedobacter riviphilus]